MNITALQMGAIIRENRRLCHLTQSDLAQITGVSIQAVSKWEIGQSFPDITLLPTLAEALHLSLNALFGLTGPQPDSASPFPDDGKLHVVQYLGRLLSSQECDGEEIVHSLPTLPGDALPVLCLHGSARLLGSFRRMLHVEGDLTVGGDVRLDGDPEAPEHFFCGGALMTGGSLSSNGRLKLDGDLTAGGSIMIMHGFSCGGDIHGDVKAPGDVHVCGDIEGDAFSQNGRVSASCDAESSPDFPLSRP